MLDGCDSLRLVCAVLSPVLVVGMLILANSLRGDRGFGCMCVALFGVQNAVGQVQRIHQTATLATYIGACAIIFGLLYVGRVSVRFTERRPKRKP